MTEAFVGRERELADLEERLDLTLRGNGQTCFIVGQAGSGKTALAQHLIERALAAEGELAVAAGACNAQTGIGDPYLPFREALTALSGEEHQPQEKQQGGPVNIARLRALAAISGRLLIEAAPDLVGLVVPGAGLAGRLGKAIAVSAGWTDDLKAQIRPGKARDGGVVEQSRIFEQYEAFLRRLSAQAPLILFLDDLQWADGPSIALLFHLARSLDDCRVMLLGAYRANDVAMGRDGGPHPLEAVVRELTRYAGDVTVDLDALPEEATRAFIDALVDREPNRLGPGFREAVFHKTGGLALFAVELLRALHERGVLARDADGAWVTVAPVDWEALPARVEGVIEERIARLDKDLYQMLTIASVEGETFAAEVIAGLRQEGVRQVLGRLTDELDKRHRLVTSQGLVRYDGVRLSLHRFLHNLFQQYLYNNLSEAQRMYLHLDVGNALEALLQGQTEEIAAQLARHFEEAGLPDKAAAYRLQAGDRARRVSANAEAVEHLRKGLALVADMPVGPDQQRLELGLQMTLGAALLAVHGYPWWEVRHAFARARELCAALGDPPELLPTLFGLFIHRVTRGELREAADVGVQLMALAERYEGHGTVVGAMGLAGGVLMYMGGMEDARRHLERALSLYDPERDREMAFQQGQDPGVLAASYLSWVLWFQGLPEQAVETQQRALAIAQECGHPYSQAFAAVFASVLWQMLGDHYRCRSFADLTLELSRRRSFPFWQAMAEMLHGSCLVHGGDHQAGIAAMRHGMGYWESTGMRLAMPYFRAQLAEGCMMAGLYDEGLAAAREATRTSNETGEVWWLPEQLRIEAELLALRADTASEAEGCLYRALDLAAAQGSPALGLRALLTLGRHLRDRGRAAQGYTEYARRLAALSPTLQPGATREAEALFAELCTQAQAATRH